MFCTVIDNFGDAGVCWRLARQLAAEAGWSVRLRIDRPDVLARIAPAPAVGVEVVPWSAEASAPAADVVIEAFGCRLPEPCLSALRGAPNPPVWINLEYLSAEPWIESCHGLPSPDPQSGVMKYFFFPGFTSRTGGVPCERDFDARAADLAEPEARLAFLRGLGLGELGAEHFPISVFCYPDSPLAELIDATPPIDGRRPLWLLAEPVAAAYPGLCSREADMRALPFLAQDDYDRLLLACELNFVRGEDSFVRAQLAARPFVWQAYRQAGRTHLEKLDAFLSRYLAAAPAPLAAATTAFWHAWNGDGNPLPVAWPAFLTELQAIRSHQLAWKRHLQDLGNLAGNLVKFCESRL